MSRIKDLVSHFAMLDLNNLDGVPGTLTTFHPFPLLPLEVRRKIWKKACSVPRVVPLLHRRLDRAPTTKCAEALSGQRGVPVILHVSMESRQEARLYYTAVRSQIYLQNHRERFVSAIPAGTRMIRESFPGHKEGGWRLSIYPYPYVSTPQLTETHGGPSTIRMFFINFDCDIFWHPEIEALHEEDLIFISLTKVYRGLSIQEASRTIPAGEPLYENYNFNRDVLDRIQRLVLPMNYDVKLLPALKKQYFLYAARPEKLKEIIFELPVVERYVLSETVHGHLRMAEVEDTLTELVKGLERPSPEEAEKLKIMEADRADASPVRYRTEDEAEAEAEAEAATEDIDGVEKGEEPKDVDSDKPLTSTTDDQKGPAKAAVDPVPAEKEKTLSPYPWEHAHVGFKWIQDETKDLPPGSGSPSANRDKEGWLGSVSALI